MGIARLSFTKQAVRLHPLCAFTSTKEEKACASYARTKTTKKRTFPTGPLLTCTTSRLPVHATDAIKKIKKFKKERNAAAAACAMRCFLTKESHERAQRLPSGKLWDGTAAVRDILFFFWVLRKGSRGFSPPK